MSRDSKQLRPPCQDVLDWVLSAPESSPNERAAARTIKDHGLYGHFQESVLADACQECGARAVCSYAEDCDIGDVPVCPVAVPGDGVGGERTTTP